MLASGTRALRLLMRIRLNILWTICLCHLMQKLDDTAPAVRDSAAEALGTAMKVVGEKAMGPFIDPLDKIKSDKVTLCHATLKSNQ